MAKKTKNEVPAQQAAATEQEEQLTPEQEYDKRQAEQDEPTEEEVAERALEQEQREALGATEAEQPNLLTPNQIEIQRRVEAGESISDIQHLD